MRIAARPPRWAWMFVLHRLCGYVVVVVSWQSPLRDGKTPALSTF